MTKDEYCARFREYGQDHVFAHWDTLGEAERAALLEDCAQVDFIWLQDRIQQLKAADHVETGPKELKPAPVITLPKGDAELAGLENAQRLGNDALRQEEVAVFLVAGGQGSRLGYEGPKGCYPIGPVTDRTLFQWHAEQIAARSAIHGCTIPWYIMTSRENHDDTIAFFESKNYFGLGEENVLFFKQRMVPSLDYEGKLILESPFRLAMNPDGHGGCLWALVHSGAVADMRKRGIRTLSYFQVDNPLVTIADPAFIGYHLEANAQMSSKILEKAYPEEKLGHIGYADGKLTVIEYSDMDEELMHARDEDGRLRFWAGSIAIHMLDVNFVEVIGREASLPWHIAHKKIPYWKDGTLVQPEANNGVKFETFVFDALPMTENNITMEVAREEEFAPVKNPTGVDSVESCRQLLSNRFGRWLEANGVKVLRDDEGNVVPRIEIAPRVALEANALTEHYLSIHELVETDLVLQ